MRQVQGETVLQFESFPQFKTIMIFSLNTKCLTLFLVAVMIYLLWMDICLYLELQNLPARPPAENLTAQYTFSPFHPMTVKLLMVSSFKEVCIEK